MPLIEAAYRVDRTGEEWLRGVAAAALPVLDRGAGLHVFRVERRGDALCPVDPVCVGATPAWDAAWRTTWWERWIAPLDQAALQSGISFGACTYSTQLWAALAASVATYGEFLAGLAGDGFHEVLPAWATEPSESPARPFYPDSFNLMANDGGYHVTALFANMSAPADGVLQQHEIERWERVAAHLAAGDRLRRRLASAVSQVEDAVFTPAGKVLHAEGEARTKAAREALREAARSVDAARTRGKRRTPEAALDLWRALYEGRWSVFDRFDSDGRRFLVARRNALPPAAWGPGDGEARAADAPRAPAPRLTERQRQVANLVALGHSNKAIAYELGIATPTVASLVRNVKARLGVTSRAELVRAVRLAGEVR